MGQDSEFFGAAAKANLTGEQSKILMCLLSYEVDGEIAIKQNAVAEELGLTESNVSRSIKALMDAGLISRSAEKGVDNLSLFQVERKTRRGEVNDVDDPEAALDALYDAHVLFAKELHIVNSSLAVLRIVGLNTKKLRGPGTEFLRFARLQSERVIVLGIESLFERKDEGAGLCSLRGLLGLTRNVTLLNPEAVKRFAVKYGVQPTADWRVDIECALNRQRPLVMSCTRHTSRLRNRRIAHLSQPVAEAERFVLPSVGVCEQVIEFAYDFYVFIATGFLRSSSGAELHSKVGESLYALLTKRFEMKDALYDFEDGLARS